MGTLVREGHTGDEADVGALTVWNTVKSNLVHLGARVIAQQ